MEDRIKELCRRLIENDQSSLEFQAIAVELRASLTEHILRIRTKLNEYPIAHERRSTKA